MVDAGMNLTTEILTEFEKELGVVLPNSYRKFMLKSNGGMPEEEVEFSFIEYNPVAQENCEQGSDIHYFYNIEELINVYQNLVSEELIQKSFIPIACDSFGNEILLGTDMDAAGVFFANHEIVNGDNTYWHISKIADTFDGFIDMLKPMEI